MLFLASRRFSREYQIYKSKDETSQWNPDLYRDGKTQTRASRQKRLISHTTIPTLKHLHLFNASIWNPQQTKTNMRPKQVISQQQQQKHKKQQSLTCTLASNKSTSSSNMHPSIKQDQQIAQLYSLTFNSTK